MLLRQEDGMDAHVDALLRLLADGEELHDVTEVLRVSDVIGRDLRDALDGDIVETDARVECDGREDRRLARGVEAVDVRRGVRLRVAFLLRLLEHVVVARAAFAHLREHVVRRSIHDTHDLRDAVRREALLERRDDRDAAADARLEAEVRLVRLRHREELLPVLRDDVLVRRDDVLARRERLEHVLLRGVNAAHDLDDDGDLIIAEDVLDAIRELHARKIGTRLLHVAHEHFREHDACADARGDLLQVLLEHAHHAGADRAGPQEPDLDCFLHHRHTSRLPVMPDRGLRGA